MTQIYLRNTFHLVIILLIISVTNGEICQTSRNEPGYCVKISLCNGMYQILQNKPISPENIEYLKKSQCGVEDRTAKVCCPSDINLFNDTAIPNNDGMSVTGENNPRSRVNIPKVTTQEITVLPSSSECGIQTINRRIIGGQKTFPGEFPWSAILLYNNSNALCGGALISKRYVLTAAHCIRKDLRAVRLGEYDKASDGEDCIDIPDEEKICSGPPIDVQIEQIIVHPEFNLKIGIAKDIALLRLVRDVIFNGYIRPICLPTTTKELSGNFASDYFIVAGWGLTEQRIRSNVLLKLRVKEYAFDECSKYYGNQTLRTTKIALENSQLCMGGTLNEDSCSGDSGGALMAITVRPSGIHWVSAGIVSFGTTNCGIGKPGVYTKVWNYTDWINQEIKP